MDRETELKNLSNGKDEIKKIFNCQEMIEKEKDCPDVMSFLKDSSGSKILNNNTLISERDSNGFFCGH